MAMKAYDGSTMEIYILNISGLWIHYCYYCVDFPSISMYVFVYVYVCKYGVSFTSLIEFPTR